MKLLLTLLCQCIIISGFCQSETDSLLKELNKHPQEDSVRYSLLRKLAYQYSFSDPAKGIQAAESAISLAQKLNDPVKLAGAYSNKATNLHKIGRDSEALALYKIAINLHLNAANKKGAANCYFNMAYVYFDIGDYLLAIKNEQQALELYRQLNLVSDEADAYNSIADSYMRINDYPSALKNFNQSLIINQQLNNKDNEAMVLSNIGMVYHDISKPKIALDYYQKALHINEQILNKKNLAHDYQHIGILYDDDKNFNKALNYYNKAFALNKEINNRRDMADNLINIASVSAKLKDYSSAYNNLNQALEIYKILQDDYNTAAVLNEKGKIITDCPSSFLKTLNINPNNRLTVALNYQQQGLALAKKTNSPSLTADILEDISDTYHKNHDAENALITYKQAVALRDTIFNDSQKDAITRIEMQNQFDKKEALAKAETDKKQLVATQEISKQKIIKNISFITGAIILIAAFVSFVFYKRKKEAETKKKEADLNAEITQTEMKVLRSQMNPHFIFNSLNSIGDFILRNDIKAANQYLTKFANVIRLILENSEHSSVALEDDLNALKLYMDIERLRLNNKFNYEVNVDKTVDAQNVLVPPLIFQPFVENSIWHGLNKKDGEGKIKIDIGLRDDMLVCIIEDNGVGRDRSAAFKEEAKKIAKKSLGVKITNARINMINKVNRSNASVNIIDKEEGVCAEIKLPVELSF